jgi:hypothetical protein
MDSKHLKKILGNMGADNDFRFVLRGESEAQRVKRGDAFQRAALFLKLRRFRVGKQNAVRATLPVDLRDGNEAARVLVRQGLEENGMDDTEDGGVRADAQGQSEEGDGGEAGIFLQHPCGKLHILPNGAHGPPAAAQTGAVKQTLAWWKRRLGGENVSRKSFALSGAGRNMRGQFGLFVA